MVVFRRGSWSPGTGRVTGRNDSPGLATGPQLGPHLLPRSHMPSLRPSIPGSCDGTQAFYSLSDTKLDSPGHLWTPIVKQNLVWTGHWMPPCILAADRLWACMLLLVLPLPLLKGI